MGQGSKADNGRWIEKFTYMRARVASLARIVARRDRYLLGLGGIGRGSASIRHLVVWNWVSTRERFFLTVE